MFKHGKKKVKQNPDPPKPCFVVDEQGRKYNYAKPDFGEHEILMITAGGNFREEFPSHTRAYSAIHHTIEYHKSKNLPWSKEDFTVVDL